MAVVDCGYRGHGVDKTRVLIRGTRRGLTPKLIADLRRRSAMTSISHPKGHPMIYQGTARYSVPEIILHCADIRPDCMAGRSLADKAAEIRRWHVEQRGWRDIGYHRVIDRDRAVALGRRETEIGAHVESHNRGNLGICLLRGYGASADDPFAKNITAAKAAAAKRLIAEFKGRTAIRKVVGHNDNVPKACSGFRWEDPGCRPTVQGFQLCE